MVVLGIESSCDETGIALYSKKAGVLAHHVHSQIDLHKQYGGVVPELASRDHLNKLIPLVKSCLSDANLNPSELAAIAYTAGPGLLGALLCGASVAESLAFSLNIPSIKIHHMEGHLLAPLLDETQEKPRFPFLALLVSGGHTLLVLVRAIGDYHVLGTTLDDAVGEAFDKTAKLMGIPYPGGAALARLAESGNPKAYDLPRPMTNRPGLDFSFSGLKTQVRLLLEESTSDQHADIAASFQSAVIDTLLIKCRRAIKQTHAKSLVISGGVGANIALRTSLTTFCKSRKISFHCPPPALCTDNGLMIAHAGALRLSEGKKNYHIECSPRWSLEELSSIV